MKGEKVKIGIDFVDLLMEGLKLSSKTTKEDWDDILSSIPIVKTLRFIYKLEELIERVPKEDVVAYAVFQGAVVSFADTLSEFYFTEEQKREIIKGLLPLERERVEELKRLEELQLDKFDPSELDNPESNVYKKLCEIFIDPIKSYSFVNLGDFEREFREGLKLNFWKVVEKHSNEYKFLVESLDKRWHKESLKRFKKDRYYANILKEYEDEPIFGDERNVTLKDVYVSPEFRVFRGCVKREEFFTEDNECLPLNDERRRDEFLLYKNCKDLHTFVYSILNGSLNDEERKTFNSDPLLIVILGYPGEGKSSFCRRFIYDFKRREIRWVRN